MSEKKTDASKIAREAEKKAKEQLGEQYSKDDTDDELEEVMKIDDKVEITDLISGFEKIVTSITDSPPLAIQGAAYWLVSSTVGVMAEGDYILKERLPRPNIYINIPGESGVTRKSTIIRHAKQLYKEAWERYYINAKVKNIDEVIAKKMLESGSYEGIVDEIQELTNDGVYNGTLVTPEFGNWLTGSKEYNKGLKNLIGDSLYYGNSFKQVLSKKSGSADRYIPSGFYFTMLTGMQEPELYLTRMDVKQGFTRRLPSIPIFKEDKKRKQFFLEKKDVSPQYVENYINALVDRMEEFDSSPVTTIGNPVKSSIINRRGTDYLKDSSKFIYEQEVKADKMMDSGNYPGLNGYLSCSPEILTKLVWIDGLANLDLKPNVAKNTFQIDYVSQNTKDFWNIIFPRNIDMLNKILTYEQEAPGTKKEKMFIKIRDAVNKGQYEKNGISCGSIPSRVGKGKNQVKPLIITLLESDDESMTAIRMKDEDGNKKGPAYLYTDSDLLNNFLNNNRDWTKITPKELESIW